MTHLRPYLMAAFAAAGIVMSASASAQSSSCQDAQKFLTERQSLVQQINKLTDGGKSKKLDPRAACGIFTKLVTNGEAGVKWIEANKDWCQVPDQFAEGFKTDHKRAITMKGQACGAVVKMEEMQKKAAQAQQQQQQGGRGNPFAGGLTGTYNIPKGAL